MRLIVHVEGETEETFVNEILRHYFRRLGYSRISASLVGNPRQRSSRGGIRPWPVVRGDIIAHLKQDRSCLATTMVDYYAMPQTKDGTWPGRAEAGRKPVSQRADFVEQELSKDLMLHCDGDQCHRRFVPFVTMHEFEALLFSDCARFASAMCRGDLVKSLQAIRDAFENPEHINDSPKTAPSKRVAAIMPDYQKPIHGNIADIDIGLDAIRAQCPHFHAWLLRLEEQVASGILGTGGFV